MDRNKRIPLEDYSFSEGWNDGEFYPKKLSLEEQETFGECLGLVFGLVSKKDEDRKYLRAWPWCEEQINFFKDKLNENVDFRYTEKKDGRYNLYLYNPTFHYLYETHLSPVTHIIEDSLLKGVITDAAIRTLHRGGEKIIHISKTELVAEEIVDFAVLERIHIALLDYPSINRNKISKCYSIWFYDPHEVTNYLIEDFGNVKEYVEELPNFNSLEGKAAILGEQDLLMRKKIYDKWKYMDWGYINHKEERENELGRIKRELKKLGHLIVEHQEIEDLEELKEKEKELRNSYQNIEESLFTKKDAGGHNNSYARNQWKNIRAGELYHQGL